MRDYVGEYIRESFKSSIGRGEDTEKSETAEDAQDKATWQRTPKSHRDELETLGKGETAPIKTSPYGHNGGKVEKT